MIHKVTEEDILALNLKYDNHIRTIDIDTADQWIEDDKRWPNEYI